MRAAALILALTGASVPMAAQALTPCRNMAVVQPPHIPATDEAPLGGLRPTPENPVNCTLGLPLEAEPGVTLWRCLTEWPDDIEPPEDAWSHAFLLVRDGQPMQTFKDDLMAGYFHAYQVIKVDLDADGTEERVLAAWNAQGNGLGIHAWTVRVFSADWRLITRYDEVIDWGRNSLIQAKMGCEIAITTYVERDGGGVAFEAGFVRLADGRMAESERAPVRRRLTFNFQKQRRDHFERDEDNLEGDVAGWLP